MNPHLRNRYVSDGVATASPARLLLMLYDRLALDLVQASSALNEHRPDDAGELLKHAQSIVLELRSALDVAAWSDGAKLADIYGFLAAELIEANVRRDAGKVDQCLALVEPLREAWHAAARSVAGSTALAS